MSGCDHKTDDHLNEGAGSVMSLKFFVILTGFSI